MHSNFDSSFSDFAKSYEPFPWEIDHGTHHKDIKGKHSVLINFLRYRLVTKMLDSLHRAGELKKVIDVGCYPGSFLKILRHFFGKDIQYAGVGLGFSPEYEAEMAKLGGKLICSELDPDFSAPKPSIDWGLSNYDCCLFLDAIEHLVNPIHSLDDINKSLRMGGKVIITTDNITSFGCVYPMFKNGLSPNVLPVRSHLFYRGDWRPHFREFSRDELFFYLEYCGFKVVKHEFFERKQGDFFIDGKGALNSTTRYRGIKGMVIKQLFRKLPHLRDHQIIVGEKTVDYADNLAKRPHPTTDMKEWLAIRKKFNA